jgi:Ni/Fe-hydrogenase 1 B-type cytochrome subunit
MKIHHLRRVYVWELPVRIYHWLNALVIVVLCVTGILIGNPPAILSGREASDVYWFGMVRYIHFLAAYVFLFNFLFRLYWGFVGNKYATWKNFIPVNLRFFREMWNVIRIDILLQKNKDHLSVGHNAMAGFIYFMIFIAFVVQVFTGFGLYADTSNWWFPQLFGWVTEMLGGQIFTRQLHHAAMWGFILFSVVHIYLVFYHDYVEGRGEISSMGGGWKFIEDEAFEADEQRRAEEEAEHQRRLGRFKQRLAKPGEVEQNG